MAVKRNVPTQLKIAKQKIILYFSSAIFLSVIAIISFSIHFKRTQADNYEWIIVQNSVDFSELYQNKIEWLKVAYSDLSKVNSYIECSTQFLDIADSWFSTQFIYAYEAMSIEEREAYADMSHSGTFYPVQALQVSANCINFFEITTDSGNFFTNKDMEYTKGSMIPVVLGSSYSKFLTVGSTFKGRYILNDLDFTVVGILATDSNVTINGVPLYLDDFILMPSFNCVNMPISKEDEVFQVRHYMNKLSGMYRRDDEREIRDIYQKINSYGIGSFY